MPVSRERVARLLDGSGAAEAILRARRRVRAPLLTVFTYHHVADPGPGYPFDPDTADATPAQFEEHVALLSRYCTIIGLRELDDILAGGRLPPNPALITFDDGYRSCYETALPILRRHGARAVFFLATDYIARRRLYWWERINYILRSSRVSAIELTYPEPMSLSRGSAICKLLSLVKDHYGLDTDRLLVELAAAAGVEWSPEIEHRLADELIMTWDQVRALRAAGMDIGSHTRSHRVLQTLDQDSLTEELAGARQDLQDILGQEITSIAYPVGRPIDEQPHIVAAVERAGYRIGFTNHSGVNLMVGKRDPLALRRIAMGRECSRAMFRSQLAVPLLAYNKVRLWGRTPPRDIH